MGSPKEFASNPHCIFLKKIHAAGGFAFDTQPDPEGITILREIRKPRSTESTEALRQILESAGQSEGNPCVELWKASVEIVYRNLKNVTRSGTRLWNSQIVVGLQMMNLSALLIAEMGKR